MMFKTAGEILVECGDAQEGTGPSNQPRRYRDAGGLGDPERKGNRNEGWQGQSSTSGNESKLHESGSDDPSNGFRDGIFGFWDDIEWLPCLDGKARPTKPGIVPMANGIPNRVGRLRAYGNAIVPQVAALFIRIYMERNK